MQDSLTRHNVLHVHISTPRRQLDWVEAVDHPVIPSCDESRLFLCDDGCVGLQGFGVSKATLLFAVLGAEAVGSGAAGVSLAGSHQISQVLIEVLDIPIHLVADVWVDLGSWSISDVAAIWEKSRVDSGDQLVSLLDDVFLETVTVTLQELLHIWCVRKPGQAMHVRAASVLPLEPQPVVSSS